MQSRIESKNLMLLQTAGNLLRGLLELFMCCRQQLLLAALLIICSGSSGVLIGCAAGRSSDDSSVMGSFTSLRTVHKYSESAREIMLERYGDDHPAASWPAQGTIEYYQLLRNHDGARLAAAANGSRRHLLSTASSTTAYTFFEGNETEESNGYFFYAFINIGDPATEYFVALDTASDLLWVPCACHHCAPLSSTVHTYSPNSSSTSQSVNCSNPLCSINQTTCAAASQQQSCPYTQSSLYSDTNTSGFLVEDILYFIPEYGGNPVSVPVVFGCGQTQTGYFLNGEIAPDGVLGLGTGEISVPSTLTRELGLLDSFSVCTNVSVTGRIAFGDKGPITQQTTPFVSNSSQKNLVEIATLEVGDQNISVGLNASFDTLLFFTYLPSAVYTPLVNFYKSFITLPELNVTGQGLCYNTSNPNLVLPPVNFIFPNAAVLETNGAAYGLLNPVLDTNELIGTCFGFLNSSFPEIQIGLLSMSGYSFTFNREDQLLGWIPSTCFDDITGSAPAPAPIFAPVTTPTFSTPPSPSTGPSTAPQPSAPPAPTRSAGVMEFVLPSRIICLSLLGFLLYLSLL
ncbi:unnamed protein product [Sphagnum troendelagicum]|uniref:Peptidase A1 domain-containing protein n=1 Tax=Sphagnum troendelagicum TaxID=128251 RepID=A0ABP0TGJ9_9BRYO